MKVSLCMPVDGREAMLAKALDSILAQTYKNVEVVIKDNNPAHPVIYNPAVHNRFFEFGDRLVYILSKNGRAYPAANIALANATGDILNFTGSDDVFASNDVIEKIVAAFMGPMIPIMYLPMWAYGRMIDVDINDNEIDSGWCGGHQPTTFKRQLQFNGIGTPTVFFNRAMMESVSMDRRAKMFDEQYQESADYDCWIRMWQQTEPMWMDFAISRYMRWPGQGSVVNMPAVNSEADLISKRRRGLA